MTDATATEMPAASLRGWLDRLAARDRLAVIREGVALRFELAAIAKRFEGEKAVLFPRPGGHAMPVVSGIVSNRAWIAEAMGVTTAGMIARFEEAAGNPIPCRVVESGPVREIVHDRVDLGALLPLPTHNELDSGPYITAGLVVTRSPETGAQNVAILRLQLSGPDRLGALILPRQTAHFHALAEAEGAELPVAIVIGVDPLTLLASQAIAPLGQDEFEIAGALHRAPLAVVKCLGSDLTVPADAEIVLEGRILPGLREPEGPFGEFPQYYGERRPRPVIAVDRMTRRRDAIFHTINGGGLEHLLLGAIPREATILQSLRRNFPSVVDAHLPQGGTCRYHLVVQMRKAYQGEGLPGVVCVLTGEDVKAMARPFPVAVKTGMAQYAVAVDRVRYVGEPVAIAVAQTRVQAEDAAEAIEVDYRALPAVVDPRAALDPDAPVLHPAVGGNVVHERRFRYGDPGAAFAAAPHRVEITAEFPRNTGSPIECFVVVAEYLADEAGYEVTANFQGPLAMHPVMALALGVPANRLRLKTPPDSGGSFGAKHAVFPYVVALALAARKARRPVKWVETRLEHLTGATSATNRVTTLSAAVEADGRIAALDWDQIEDCGAYLRAPEPATLYRMHGNMTGAYAIPNLAIRNRVVATNKTPSGLVRGFGGPQVYFALERLVGRIAETLDLDPVEVIRRNLVDRFPHPCPAGAVLDSGDYRGAVDRATDEGGLAELRQRRDAARREGRLYGIGYAAVVEPSISNMGYITTALTPEEPRAAGPKGGAQAMATVALDPLGGVSAVIDSLPQGQGHRTVVAEVVARAFGIEPRAVRVEATLDTARDAWSIAAGNYSSRFAGAVAGAAHLAAMRLRDRLARIAAPQLNLRPEEIVFAAGRVGADANPKNTLSFARVAAASHWAPETVPEAALRETAAWSPETLAAPNEADQINSSAAHGFVFDFCGVEVDRETGEIRIDRYVTMHDAGAILNRTLFDGQVMGGFAHGVGIALMERLAYGEDGGMLSGSFLDYALPRAGDVPSPVVLHQETPSPVTPLGAKGVAEGNSMSTPVCIANAVADALRIRDVTLPLTPARVRALIRDV